MNSSVIIGGKLLSSETLTAYVASVVMNLGTLLEPNRLRQVGVQSDMLLVWVWWSRPELQKSRRVLVYIMSGLFVRVKPCPLLAGIAASVIELSVLVFKSLFVLSCLLSAPSVLSFGMENATTKS